MVPNSVRELRPLNLGQSATEGQTGEFPRDLGPFRGVLRAAELVKKIYEVCVFIVRRASVFRSRLGLLRRKLRAAGFLWRALFLQLPGLRGHVRDATRAQN